MLRVVIADDEERIVKLIHALIDWESLELELVGIAHNGIEAKQLVEETRPDILITDIRMPGCDGMELISSVKEKLPETEIVIISGYAHFDYARQAIRYGVGDYLLKPINKIELCDTLAKLTQNIRNNQTRERTERTDNRTETEIICQQKNLLEALAEERAPVLSRNILRDVYHLQVQGGVFRAFKVRVDFGVGAETDSSVLVQMQKFQDILERELKGTCHDLLLAIREADCLGILNYEESRQEQIRRILKHCLNQMEMQKSLFRDAKITLGLGSAVTEPEQLKESMREATLLVQERIVKGTGRLFEKLKEASSLPREEILEKYMRKAAAAIENLDTELSDDAVRMLENEADRTRELRGFEAVNLAVSAVRIFLISAHVPVDEAVTEKLIKQCNQCSSLSELWNWVKEFQKTHILELQRERENDSVRPIRMAKQYMANHFSEPITLESISEYVGLSSAYFSALFKKTEREGFVKYLTNLRINEAKALLRESTLSVADICRKVGYNDLKHFTQTFEKTTGIKPAAYRKLYG